MHYTTKFIVLSLHDVLYLASPTVAPVETYSSACRKLSSIDLFSISHLHALVTVDISNSTAQMERCTLYYHMMLELTASCCSYMVL